MNKTGKVTPNLSSAQEARTRCGADDMRSVRTTR